MKFIRSIFFIMFIANSLALSAQQADWDYSTEIRGDKSAIPTQFEIAKAEFQGGIPNLYYLLRNPVKVNAGTQYIFSLFSWEITGKGVLIGQYTQGDTTLKANTGSPFSIIHSRSFMAKQYPDIIGYNTMQKDYKLVSKAENGFTVVEDRSEYNFVSNSYSTSSYDVKDVSVTLPQSDGVPTFWQSYVNQPSLTYTAVYGIGYKNIPEKKYSEYMDFWFLTYDKDGQLLNQERIDFPYARDVVSKLDLFDYTKGKEYKGKVVLFDDRTFMGKKFRDPDAGNHGFAYFDPQGKLVYTYSFKVGDEKRSEIKPVMVFMRNEKIYLLYKGYDKTGMNYSLIVFGKSGVEQVDANYGQQFIDKEVSEKNSLSPEGKRSIGGGPLMDQHGVSLAYDGSLYPLGIENLNDGGILIYCQMVFSDVNLGGNLYGDLAVINVGADDKIKNVYLGNIASETYAKKPSLVKIFKISDTKYAFASQRINHDKMVALHSANGNQLRLINTEDWKAYVTDPIIVFVDLDKKAVSNTIVETPLSASCMLSNSVFFDAKSKLFYVFAQLLDEKTNKISIVGKKIAAE